MFKYKAIFVSWFTLACLFAPPLASKAQNTSDQPGTSILSLLSDEEKEWLNNHQTINVSGPVAFPPFHFYRTDSATAGMASDYLSLLAKKIGLKTKVQKKTTWPKILEGMSTGKIDLLACAAKSPKRERDLLFSKPYLSFPMIIVNRKDTPFIGGINDLHGKKVACIRKASTFEWLVRDQINVVPYFVDTPLKGLKAVSLGNADAYIGNLAAISYLIEKNGIANLKIAAPTIYGNYDLFFATRKELPHLLSILNKGLESITPEEHSAIRTRWLSIRYEHGIQMKDVIKWVLLVFTTTSIIIFIIFTWNRRLNKEIIKRKRIEEALRTSEERFRDISLSMADWIWEIESSGKFTFVSDSVETILGFSSQEMIGKTHLEFVSEREAARLKNYFNEIKSKSEPIVDVECWYHTKDGEEVCLRTNAIPILNKNRKVLGYRGVDKDITLQKKLEKEKNYIEEQLKQSTKMEAIGTLAGGIAHDFNNILGIIIGNTELAYEDVPESSMVRINLEEIKIASMRAKDVVRQLLSFSRKTDQERKPVNVPSIISESLKLLRALIPSTIEIKTQISDTVDTILADSTQIHQILLNLCTNAAHAMQEKGGSLEIILKNLTLEKNTSMIVHNLQPGRYVQLTICDTGHGISPEIKERIFDPYFTTKEVGKGTGMGLAVVLGIIKNHDAAITIDSNTGMGTSVSVFFPSIDSRPSKKKPPNNKLPTGNETIFLIDDEDAMVNLGELILKRLGYRVETSTSPVDALKRIRETPHQFDLIISDMTMPVMTGDTLTEKILEIRRDLPVILCTGFNEKINAEIASGIGVKKYIEKPLDMQELAFAVREALEESHQAD